MVLIDISVDPLRRKKAWDEGEEREEGDSSLKVVHARPLYPTDRSRP